VRGGREEKREVREGCETERNKRNIGRGERGSYRMGVVNKEWRDMEGWEPGRQGDELKCKKLRRQKKYENMETVETDEVGKQ
jgi:hypothetical protein